MVRSTTVSSPFLQMPIPTFDPDVIAKLPSGFQATARSGMLSNPILKLIVKMADKHDFYGGNVWSAPHSIPEATLLDLAQTYPGLATPNDAKGPALEKLICLVLMRTRVDRVLVPALRTPSCMSHSITLELTEQIPLRVIPAQIDERECLLWIWLMTLECWPVESALAKGWLVKTVVRFPEIACWELQDFETFGNRFIWTEHLSHVLQRHRGGMWSRGQLSDV